MIIGITGPQGAGKTKLAEFLVHNYNAEHLSVRKFLEAQLPKGAGRDDMVQLANHLRTIRGPEYIISQLLKKAHAYDLAVVESIRTPREVDYVSIHDGKLFAVDAPQKLRYERAVARGAATDNISFKEFRRQELQEAFSTNVNEQNIRACVQRADELFFNAGAAKEFYRSIDKVMFKYQ